MKTPSAMFRLCLLLLPHCLCFAQENKEVVYVDNIKKGPLVTLPIPFSESDKLIAAGNDTLGTILDCDVQNRISDPSAQNQGYSFLRCTQLIAKIKKLPSVVEVDDTITTPAPGGSGLWGDDNGPRAGASRSGHQQCRDLILDSINLDDIRYQIQERGIKVLIVNFGDSQSNRTSHLVWTASNGAEYLLEQSFWYRLFSLAPMSLSVSEVTVILNTNGDLDQQKFDQCEDYIFIPPAASGDRREALVQHGTSLSHDLGQLIQSNQSSRLYYDSAMCARVDDADNTSDGGHFKTSCHMDYVCCNRRQPYACREVREMPCVLLFYKIILYVIWWLVVMPVFLVLPFHTAYERCDSDGRHDRKTGAYYRINSTNSMLFTLICKSIITKIIVYAMAVLLVFYQIWAEFGRYDNYLDIPWWVYVFLMATLLLAPLFKIFWELWGKDIDVEHHRPTKYAARIVRDTFWGAVDLPDNCQLRDTLVPTRSGIRLRIIYRLRLLLQDRYWLFCARDLPRRCCKNKICGIILAPLTIVLGFLNALPAIYILSTLVLAAKNRHKINYMKKRWLVFLISLVIIGPVLIAASYTLLLLLYHSTSIVILDINALPAVALYILLLDYIWQNLRQMNCVYLGIITQLIKEHQKVVRSMHKGKLSVTQHCDIYDNAEVPVGGVKRRPRENTVFARSFRDTLRRESNMAALRAGMPLSRPEERAKTAKPNSKQKMYSLDFEDRSATSPTKSSMGSPLLPGSTSSTYMIPAANTAHLLLHYNGPVLYINARFHGDLMDTLLPPSVCAFKLVLNIMFLGFGYAILDEFFRCYAPLMPCCLYIIVFLVLGLSRILLAIQQHTYRFPQDLKLQVRALVENFYVGMCVDPDETGKLDLVLRTSNVDSTADITDIESVTTTDDVPPWTGRISFGLQREDPGYDADYNSSIHRSREPSKRITKPPPRRQPLSESTVPSKQERSLPIPPIKPQNAPIVQSNMRRNQQLPSGTKVTVAPRQPSKIPETREEPKNNPIITVPRHTITPKSRPSSTKAKPQTVTTLAPEPEDKTPSVCRETPIQSHSLPRTRGSPGPSSPPHSSTLPKHNEQTSPPQKLTVQYVPLIDRPNTRPRSHVEPPRPISKGFPDDMVPTQPNRQHQPRDPGPNGPVTSPENQHGPNNRSEPQQPKQSPARDPGLKVSPTSPVRQSAPVSDHPDPRYVQRDPREQQRRVDFPARQTKTTTIYMSVPRRPHPKPATPLQYREVQSEPEIPFCDDETSEDDLLFDDLTTVPSPSSQPVEHSTTYSILPALEEEPVTLRTATLRRHVKDRYSQPEPIQLFLHDTRYNTLQPAQRHSALPKRRSEGSGRAYGQLSRSHETL